MFCYKSVTSNVILNKPLVNKNIPIIKKQRVIMYDNSDDIWNHGEVSWDFPELSKEKEKEKENDIIPYYYEENVIVNNIVTNMENTIYNKYFKNKIIFRKKHKNLYLKEIYSSFIKVAYKDAVKFETFMDEFQDFTNSNLNTPNIENQIFLLLLTSILGLLYNKNKVDDINNYKLIHKSKRKREIIEKTQKIRKNATIFFIIFTTIFNKNIRNAE